MIAKPRTKPISLLKLEALLKRLPEVHPKYSLIKSDYAKQKAGYLGEKFLEYPLSCLPGKDYLIFNDLRLLNGKHFFQMDVLLLTPFFISILEVKNISGSIFFNSLFKQIIRTIEGKEEGFADPVAQVKRQAEHLRDWLERYGFPALPVVPLVVIANERTVIKFDPRDKITPNFVIPSSDIISNMRFYDKKFTSPFLTPRQVKKLYSRLIADHTPVEMDIIQRYALQKTDLIKGVQCPGCLSFPMNRVHGNWKCLRCSHVSQDAHNQALKDYALLIKTSITNKEARDFLGSISSDTAKRILQQTCKVSEGNNKGKLYFIPVDKV